MITQIPQFEKGDFVQTIEDSTLLGLCVVRNKKFGLYGIVFGIGDCHPNLLLREYLVYLQDGRRHWYWSSELIKATDDGS